QYVSRGLDKATAEGAAAVLIELDTPGGLDSSMRRITGAMLRSTVPVIVYVTPAGARAGSAGVFIMMAADVAAMAPGTNVGAAHPVADAGDNLADDERTKVTNDAAAYMRTLATTRHHNATWAEAAVRQSVSLTADEALQQGVVDVLSPDRAHLLASLDGRTIQRPDGPRVLRIHADAIQPLEMTVGERLLHLIDDPNIAYLLLSLGAWALLAEFFHPGSLLPGITGVICLALALTALESLPLNLTGLALILGALALFVVDLKAPTHGALTAAGFACFVVGSLMLFAPVAWPPPILGAADAGLAVSPVLVGLIGLGLSAFFAVAVRASLRARRRPVAALAIADAGMLGVAVTDLAPTGTVRIRGENWTADADGEAIREGQPVRVISRKGLHLRVRRG
ncbi:MAG TPA: nodulation protein NfeD, partial [Chloroflexota bacterium]|nr:nodulation protein NfeD [Chloroflexota bacterium]